MRAKHYYLILLYLLRAAGILGAQEDRSWQFTGHLDYGIHAPWLDLDDRFGLFFKLGTGVSLISETDWVMSLKYHFLFGSEVKEDVLKSLRNSSGEIISSSLIPTFPLLRLRGHQVGFTAGKWFSLGENHDQGILFQLGPGVVNHRIQIQDDADPIPQLRPPYRKGYDRLTGGIGGISTLGYQYISANRQISFYVVLESTFFWTRSRRNFNLDTFEIDNAIRSDGSIGIQAGWIFPLVY